MASHVFTDFEDGIETKSMWGNAVTSTAVEGKFVRNDGNSLMKMRLDYTPRIYQIFDEIIINVADQHIKSGVRACDVTVCADGSIEVTNYGPGFVVDQNQQTGEWGPFILSAYVNQGNNHGDQTRSGFTSNLPTGGVNGIGLKLSVRSSVWFEIHTVDQRNQRYYTVRYRHRGRAWVLGRPQAQKINSSNFDRRNLPFDVEHEEVVDLSRGALQGSITRQVGREMRTLSAGEPFTMMRFLPRYKDYGMHGSPADLFRAFRTRLYEIATYITVPITFNGSRVPVSGLTDYIKLAEAADGANDNPIFVSLCDPEQLKDFDKWPADRRAALFAKTTASHYPMRVGVTVSKNGQSTRWACINGVIITHGSCSIFSHFIDQIKTHFSRSYGSDEFGQRVKGCISIYIVGQVASPNWSAQSKVNITFPTGFLDAYVLGDKALTAITAALKNVIREQKHIEEIKDLRAAMARPAKVRPEKMQMSSVSTLQKKWDERRKVALFMVEGNSAEKFVTSGLAAKDCCMDVKYVSIYIMTGVMMNVRREVVEDANQRIPSKRLLDYNIWNEFMYMTGLKYGRTYETEDELRTLLCGKIIILTDQDVDGEGNITSLIVNFIDTFFPALIRRGMVYRLATELIRIFDRNTYIRGFHNECDYREWALSNHYYNMVSNDILGLAPEIRRRNPELANQFAAEIMSAHGNTLSPAALDELMNMRFRKYISENVSTRKFTHEYYKGLAGHSTTFCKRAFSKESFLKNIIRFIYDSDARKTFEDFFSENSEPRKIELRKGTRERVINADNTMTCTEMLTGPLVIYSLEDMRRKLSGQYDGLNDAKRRILYGALQSMVKNRYYKIDTLAGIISIAGHYHHGNAILEDTMKLCAATYFGARRIPFFIIEGDTGSRKNPVPGASRYLMGRINHDGLEYLYPMRDLDILPRRVEDGEVSVVNYFCTTIPPIFETANMPSHGWRIESHAMSISSLLAITRHMIDRDGREHDDPAPRLALDVNGWRGRIVAVTDENGKVSHLSVGRFTYADQVLTVTELPFFCDLAMYQRYLIRLADSSNDETTASEMLTDNSKTHPFIANWSPNSLSVEGATGIPLDPNEVRLTFKISASRISELQKTRFKGIELDPETAIAHGIGLTTLIGRHLNYMDPQDRIVEFPNYESIIAAWYPMRKSLYIECIERERILLILERAHITECQRAIDENIGDQIRARDLDESIALCARRRFFKFAPAVIHNSAKYLTPSIVMYATGFVDIAAFIKAWSERAESTGTSTDLMADDAAERISYDYIFNMRHRDAMMSATTERRNRLTKIDQRLAELGAPDPWKTMWLADLHGLERVCAKYLPTMWTGLGKGVESS